ncbi:MAG: conjugative transfer system coupling protein TraD, partial [Alphaproteobacteria bacterium]|nr:conjugative transfer system coupling protein TraD [Alphaproteobacteria bacterium]
KFLRGECVIIVDPKGDGELRENARKACEMAGKPEAFAFFHPAFPRESVRINPLKNFNRPMEVASRIAALIPSETGADPFKAFGQMALNNVIQGLLTVNETPLLTTIKRYLEAGVEGLVLRVVDAYCTRVMPNWVKEAAPVLDKAKDKVAALTKLYHAKIAPDHPSPDLEGLLAMAAHNKDHLAKMIASLNPIMSMLTSGELAPLLSPRADDMDDPRPILDLQTIIKDARVLYIGLDSLSDAMVGSAIGAMLLSDLTTVAGDRYNYAEQDDLRPVNIFVDEAAETVNDPFLQMLNKGRGAKYRLIAATQTLSDFVTRTGSEDKAYQLLGNLNNMIALRVVDGKTQEYIAKTLGMTKIQYIMTTQGSNVTNEIAFGGNAGERLMEEEAELFPSPLLGRLPNLEFIAMTAGGKVWKGRVPILGKEKS